MHAYIHVCMHGVYVIVQYICISDVYFWGRLYLQNTRRRNLQVVGLSSTIGFCDNEEALGRAAPEGLMHALTQTSL